MIRGAPCGATWDAADRVRGMTVQDGIVRMGLEVQFFCTADPAGWDPIYGKSPVHLAGRLHSSALARAVDLSGASSSGRTESGETEGRAE